MNEVQHQGTTNTITGDSGRIMLVDDNPDNLRTLKSLLEAYGYKTFAAISGELALEAVGEVQPELILLDIQMPNMDGYEVCQRLKAEPRYRDIPVLFISARTEPMDKVKAFEVGGVDFITKPFQSEEVLARVKTHLSLYRLRQDLERARDELEYRVKARTAELVEANKVIRESEVYYRSIFENALYGIAITGPDFKFLEVNNAWCDLIGYTREELLGKMGIADVTLPEDLEASMKFVNQMINREVKQSILEKRYRTKSGKIIDTFAFVKAIYDKDGQYAGSSASIMDITERKLAEDALRKAEEESVKQRERLARLARIQVAGEMATSFAHELNQPLAAIESYAQAGLQRLENDANNIAKLKELLKKIRSQANRAGNVIEHLRAMVKKHETRNVIVNINELLYETVGLAEIEIGACGCQVKIISDHEVPRIKVDKIQIQQVILNLIRNAIDAVSDLKEKDRKPLVIQSSVNEKKEVEVSIIDNGRRIPDSEVEKLFEPFYSTKESGMGIGLSICRTIIEAHGGKIGYRPNPTGGAIFYFSLPGISAKV